MDYTKTPGKNLNPIGKIEERKKPQISIITPFYNGGDTILNTAYSVLNQTYPYFEWIIVDDGSQEKDSLKKLEQVAKLDERIVVYHKKNEGPAMARDYGVQQTKDTKYVFFLDCDDLIEKEMLECCYWTLETHPQASFCYTSMVNFGDAEFIWNQDLTVRRELEENFISTSSMVVKKDFQEVGGFGIREKAMYEDWNLWLKLLAHEKIPIHISTPLFWYRVSRGGGEFSRAKKNNKNAMKYVNETIRTIHKELPIIQFPREGEKYATVQTYENMVLPQYKKTNKTKILFLFPWLVVGGADYFNLDLIKRLDPKKYEAVILTTLPNDHPLFQEFSQYATEIYDMAGFLERIDYLSFTDYIISSRNIDAVFISNTQYGYYMTPYLKSKYPQIPFVDYIHSVDLRGNHGSFGQYSKDVDSYLTKTYCCNQFTKRQLKDSFQKENVKTIYIGTDSEKYDPKKFDKEKLKEKYQLPKNKKIISFVARLSDEKRPLLFIDIAMKLLEKNADYYFLIAGDGPLMSSVIEKVGENPNFKVFGMVDCPEEIFAVSDVSVNCSSLEGLALTSYESLSMDVPVVSSSVGGQTELIDDSVGAIVPYPNSSNEIDEYVTQIEKVTAHLERYQQVCRKKITGKFSVSLMAKQMIKEIEDCIEKEKNKKVVWMDAHLYEVSSQLFHEQYYFICKDYIEKKYNRVYLGCSHVEENFIDPIRILWKKRLREWNILDEIERILDVPRYLKACLKNIISLLKSLLVAILMCFTIIYKLLKNGND